MSKIVDGLKQGLRSAKCEHRFVPISGPHSGSLRVVARCGLCECRFTSWPGTPHYEDIITAIEAERAAN